MTEPTTETETGKAKAEDPKAYSEFTETVKLTPEEEAARKRRNMMIAVSLVAFAVLIAVTTMLRLSSNYNAGA